MFHDGIYYDTFIAHTHTQTLLAYTHMHAHSYGSIHDSFIHTCVAPRLPFESNVCIHAHTHTHAHAHAHSQHTHTHAHAHTQKHFHMSNMAHLCTTVLHHLSLLNAYAGAYTHPPTHTYSEHTHTRPRVRTHTYVFIWVIWRIRTHQRCTTIRLWMQYALTHTHTYTHTHTHKHS